MARTVGTLWHGPEPDSMVDAITLIDEFEEQVWPA
jgi:hypothetical protein